ncbi:excisionase [Peptostreptococcus faecalis]|uniref:excisionase n=1 Tax=Peptostreptococcus faecalis TaxID=2045015 RepID=UPI000C7D5C9A|nr:excisionase [Peptostreptococcus faecalis]
MSEKNKGYDVEGKNVPLWEKSNLTLQEASQYFNIGIHKLRELSEEPDCKFVLFVGKKRLIKKKILEEYLKTIYSI